MHEKTNLGVRPVEIIGGKVSMGTSEVVIAEANALSNYIKDLKDAGRVKSEDIAKKHRVAMVKYYTELDRIHGTNSVKKLKKLLDILGYSY